MSLKPLRFITLPISHYCEKVRWALDRAGMSYDDLVVRILALATLG